MSDMRILYILFFAAFVCTIAVAQSPRETLADKIDISRTIIAKLDRATLNDPPPNFASSILVRVHKEATNFTELADSTSALLRKGNSAEATSMFDIYSQFVDLYSEYETFADVTSTATPAKQIDLATVQSVAMGREFFETKTFLQAATYAQLMQLDDDIKVCHPSPAAPRRQK